MSYLASWGSEKVSSSAIRSKLQPLLPLSPDVGVAKIDDWLRSLPPRQTCAPRIGKPLTGRAGEKENEK